jgi:hypothetical protein
VTSSSQSEQPEETVSSEELVIEDSLDSN